MLKSVKQNVEAAHEKQKVDYMPVHLCMSLGLKSLPKVLVKDFTCKKRKEGKLDF